MTSSWITIDKIKENKFFSVDIRHMSYEHFAKCLVGYKTVIYCDRKSIMVGLAASNQHGTEC